LVFEKSQKVQASDCIKISCSRQVENVDRYDDRVRVEANLIESFGVLMDFIRKHTLDRFILNDSYLKPVLEDAIRNAITGSIAEAAYGIPKAIADKALSCFEAPLRMFTSGGLRSTRAILR
jgi:predicted HTH transcriptional regulator